MLFLRHSIEYCRLDLFVLVLRGHVDDEKDSRDLNRFFHTDCTGYERLDELAHALRIAFGLRMADHKTDN